MAQNKKSKNDAGEITISNNWNIENSTTTKEYMLSNKGVFIHGNKLKVATLTRNYNWLNIYFNDNYIASIWIPNKESVKKVREFVRNNKLGD